MNDGNRPHPVVLLMDLEGTVIQAGSGISFETLAWVPGVFGALGRLAASGLFSLRTLSGSAESSVHMDVRIVQKILETLAGEGVVFEDEGPCDPEKSFVIGSKGSDVELAKRHGCPLVWVGEDAHAAVAGKSVVLACNDSGWAGVAAWLLGDATVRSHRTVSTERSTNETTISLELDLDGTGVSSIATGLPFFDHMLQQVARHGRLDLRLAARGDLEVDEHHTVEDVAIVLGQAFRTALGDKRGINRYGFEILTMDDCRATVALDFSGRPWFAWDVSFCRDVVGSFPTELFSHFFKSFSDESGCNLHMAVTSGNTHHQAEALFKAFGRSLRTAVFRYPWNHDVPSTKGVL